MSSKKNELFSLFRTLSGAMRSSLVLVVLLSVVQMVYGDCPQPTGGPNMIIEGPLPTFPVSDGTAVTFICEVGYRKLGSGRITCTNGQWTRINMRCEIMNCGSSKEVINGRVDYSEGTEFGAFARVVCNEGYMAVGGDKQIYCGVQGWQGRLQVCEVLMCDAPDPIANGHFSPMKDEYEHSEVITYSCAGDLKLNGSATATCQEDGRFKPAPPKCVSVNCRPLKVTNAVVAAGTFQGPYKHQSTVTFRCHRGHNLKGHDTVSCDINSEWSPAMPECLPIECELPEIKNAEVVNGARLTYKFEETVTLKCTEGYRPTDPVTLTCGEGSRWSAALPECILIQCQTPQVKYGVLVGDLLPSYKYSDNVTFKCSEDYELVGASTLTCNVNGQWSPKLPQCTLAVSCRAPEVTDGHVVEGSRPSYKYLDSVLFECKSGYTMSGQSNLTCARNSQWSPEPPQCTPDTPPPDNTLKIVLGCLGGLLLVGVVGVSYYFGYEKPKKSHRKEYSGASQDPDAVALS